MRKEMWQVAVMVAPKMFKVLEDRGRQLQWISHSKQVGGRLSCTTLIVLNKGRPVDFNGICSPSSEAWKMRAIHSRKAFKVPSEAIGYESGLVTVSPMRYHTAMKYALTENSNSR